MSKPGGRVREERGVVGKLQIGNVRLSSLCSHPSLFSKLSTSFWVKVNDYLLQKGSEVACAPFIRFR